MSEINYSKLNYYGTKVAISKSQEAIKKFLVKFGLQGTRFTEYKNVGVIEFILFKNGKEMAFRFKYDFPENKNHKRQVYRALFHYLKNRFVAIEFGITTIEDEFFQELVLKLPNGATSTVKEIVKNQLNQLEYSSELQLPFKKKEGD
ncbi:hypothetical protein LCGC14_1183750 [marine sediment metagenome]|uniref:Uncharacterized protein n=1 Tax=marine sediment metagenome TaxID=412755 RepID=A0A0F9PRW0_9ZZZZ